MTEHQVAVVGIGRFVAQSRKGVGDPGGEWDGAAGALGLRVVELAPHVRRNDTDLPGRQVDVAPAQAE
jgi:hypothetical protein